VWVSCNGNELTHVWATGRWCVCRNRLEGIVPTNPTREGTVVLKLNGRQVGPGGSQAVQQCVHNIVRAPLVRKCHVGMAPGKGVHGCGQPVGMVCVCGLWCSVCVGR